MGCQGRAEEGGREPPSRKGEMRAGRWPLSSPGVQRRDSGAGPGPTYPRVTHTQQQRRLQTVSLTRKEGAFGDSIISTRKERPIHCQHTAATSKSQITFI